MNSRDGQLRFHGGVLFGALFLAGCVSDQAATGGQQAAGGDNTMALIGPSKSWHKPGVPGKQAWEAWQKCLQLPGNRKESDACMTSQGFRYGKTDDIYVPPPPPPKGWMKLGVDLTEGLDSKRRCLDHEYSQEYLNVCMAEQGFEYRELTEQELPVCGGVGVSQPCRQPQ